MLSRRQSLRLAAGAGAAWMLGGGCVRPAAESAADRQAARPPVVPRPIPEGTVPQLAVEGTAYDCGRHYGELVQQRYPGYRRYLDQAVPWRTLPGKARVLFERRAPYVLDVYRGLLDATDQPAATQAAAAPAGPAGCTSFGVDGSLTLDGTPISGQTKDTVIDSARLYVVLRMRIRGGPSILVLAYPGEVLGYGLWSTGMSIFRNAIYSRGGERAGLTMEQWGLLALAGSTVDEAVELACRHGISTVGNFLISDSAGRSVNVESNAGGVSVVPARDGIATHANHPVGQSTAPYEDYPGPVGRENSRYRQERLWHLLDAERGRLTAPKAMMYLADHDRYPYGICRHAMEENPTHFTTAAVVAEPARGRLHVTRANPCANWPVTYSLYEQYTTQ